MSTPSKSIALFGNHTKELVSELQNAEYELAKCASSTEVSVNRNAGCPWILMVLDHFALSRSNSTRPSMLSLLSQALTMVSIIAHIYPMS